MNFDLRKAIETLRFASCKNVQLNLWGYSHGRKLSVFDKDFLKVYMDIEEAKAYNKYGENLARKYIYEAEWQIEHGNSDEIPF